MKYTLLAVFAALFTTAATAQTPAVTTNRHDTMVGGATSMYKAGVSPVVFNTVWDKGTPISYGFVVTYANRLTVYPDGRMEIKGDTMRLLREMVNFINRADSIISTLRR